MFANCSQLNPLFLRWYMLWRKQEGEMPINDGAIWYTVYTPPAGDFPFLAVTHLPTGDVSAVPFRTYEEAEQHIAAMTSAQTQVLNEVLEEKGLKATSAL
jgi:hypothetical protein